MTFWKEILFVGKQNARRDFLYLFHASSCDFQVSILWLRLSKIQLCKWARFSEAGFKGDCDCLKWEKRSCRFTNSIALFSFLASVAHQISHKLQLQIIWSEIWSNLHHHRSARRAPLRGEMRREAASKLHLALRKIRKQNWNCKSTLFMEQAEKGIFYPNQLHSH